MKDLGKAKYILGIEIVKDETNGSISINQKGNIQQVLCRFKMDDCNPMSSPLDTNQTLTKEMAPKNDHEKGEMKDIPYQEAIGSILFIAQVTRPDIQYAASLLSRFNNNPGKAHWIATKRVLRYLKGTMDYSITYTKDM